MSTPGCSSIPPQEGLIGGSALERVLPHRPPFLLLDAILRSGPGWCISSRFVDPADGIFTGHFPGYPIFPGVLILEIMAQTACYLLGSEDTERVNGRVPMLARVRDVNFRTEVRPGETILTRVTLERTVQDLVILSGTAMVLEQRIADATFVIHRGRQVSDQTEGR